MKRLNIIEITGNNLTLDEIIQVSCCKASVKLHESVQEKVQASYDHLHSVLARGEAVYGVNTNFGGMANSIIHEEDRNFLQEHLIQGLKCGSGKKLPTTHVRAGMLIRANSLARGASGIRYELIERLVLFLNAHMTPVIYEHGSIGASGDLVPLSYVAGALTALKPGYEVEYQGRIMDAEEALKILNLNPLGLQAKEGLALVNGTSMMAGIAAQSIHEASILFDLSLAIHALFITALQGNMEAFEPFVHFHKPHKGQIAVSDKMRELLSGCELLSSQNKPLKNNFLLQDRYSIRCLPQYLGVIADGLMSIKEQIEIEANSATDNPLIDPQNQKIYHGGNFMGQYIAVGMDQLRYYLGLLAKHIDTQIALLVTPEFNNGLPASLASEEESAVKFGLKGLQICGNSIMPLLLHQGAAMAPLFPTHAEQFNQNINSQGFASANLAWQSIQLTRQYLAIALIFAVQSIDLRCYKKYGNYYSSQYLSGPLAKVYKAVRNVVEGKNDLSEQSPFVGREATQTLDKYIQLIVQDIETPNGYILQALQKIQLGTLEAINAF